MAGSGAPSTVIDDAETINRKCREEEHQGKENTNENDTPKDKISVSQQSYDLKIDHFEKLIELLAIEPKYKPNEVQLKVDSLRAYKSELDELNTRVKSVYLPYNNALNERNRVLYTAPGALVERANAVKQYVKSVYGTQEPEYKMVTKIVFRKLVKNE